MSYRMIAVYSAVLLHFVLNYFQNLVNGLRKKNLSCTLTCSPGTGAPDLSRVQWAAVNMFLNKVTLQQNIWISIIEFFCIGKYLDNI